MPHDGPGEHYHDIGERIAGQDDTVVWTTVGLDIGSSTSQAVFSRITLAREDAYYVVVDRAILHQSEILLTPYATPALIDRGRLREFVDREFVLANLTRDAIDTGAVIMTGLALTTANARAIADVIADDSGRFVAVSAGDTLEARLAANGACLPELSAAHRGLILHIDIGGGTTKLSVWQDCSLLHLAAIDVGARLITLDDQQRVTRIEPPARRASERLGLRVTVGEVLSVDTAKAVARQLAQEILRHAGVLREGALDEALLRTAPLFATPDVPTFAAVVFSGGVSEYIYRRERRDFGDLGLWLGDAVRDAIDASGVAVLQSDRGIRATVLGASQHSMQLSGNTIFVSEGAALPLRNVPVVLPMVDLSAAMLDSAQLSGVMVDGLKGYSAATAGRNGAAIAIRWQGSATFERLQAVASGIARAMTARLPEDMPWVIIVDGDVAGLLGDHLNQLAQGRRSVICLDGIQVHEFDHIDIGEFTAHARALPVVVKSLLFAQNMSYQHVRH